MPTYKRHTILLYDRHKHSTSHTVVVVVDYKVPNLFIYSRPLTPTESNVSSVRVELLYHELKFDCWQYMRWISLE